MQKTFAIQQKALKIQGLREYHETNATMDFGIVWGMQHERFRISWKRSSATTKAWRVIGVIRQPGVQNFWQKPRWDGADGLISKLCFGYWLIPSRSLRWRIWIEFKFYWTCWMVASMTTIMNWNGICILHGLGHGLNSHNFRWLYRLHNAIQLLLAQWVQGCQLSLPRHGVWLLAGPPIKCIRFVDQVSLLLLGQLRQQQLHLTQVTAPTP